MVRCDLIRFIVGVIHPTNELLCSDIIPRWAVIGQLLKNLIDAGDLHKVLNIFMFNQRLFFNTFKFIYFISVITCLLHYINPYFVQIDIIKRSCLSKTGLCCVTCTHPDTEQLLCFLFTGLFKIIIWVLTFVFLFHSFMLLIVFLI